jgi:hypothetical protein
MGMQHAREELEMRTELQWENPKYFRVNGSVMLKLTTK